MFSYTYEITLIGHRLAEGGVFSDMDLGGLLVSIEPKDGGSFLVTSNGHPTHDEAGKHLSEVFMRLKVALLQMGVAHLDWFSLTELQKFAADTVGSFFAKSGIVPVSYQPKIYETGRFVHRPGAVAKENEISPETIVDCCKTASRHDALSIREFEALTVLGLALADPHAKSKLILSMTAIEVLIERGAVDEGLLRALDLTKAMVSQLQASDEHKEKVAKILDAARVESITKAGKRLVKQRLGKKRAAEFYRLYDVRSEAVHGNPARFSVDLDGSSEMEKHAADAFALALDLVLSAPASSLSTDS